MYFVAVSFPLNGGAEYHMKSSGMRSEERDRIHPLFNLDYE